MNKGRIFTIAFFVGVSALGLTVLMAARAANEKAENPPSSAKPAQEKKRLVFLGDVDTESRMVNVFPRNFPMPSRVTAVKVKEGEEVTKGQALLEFDNEMLDQKVAEADAGVREAQGKLAQAEAAIRAHKPTVDALEQTLLGKQAELEDKQNALKEAQRLHDIRGGESLTLKSAAAAVEAATRNLSAARIQWEYARTEAPTYAVDQAKAAIDRYKSLKKQAETARDQVSCPAPADGKIVRVNAYEGEVFNQGTREPAFLFLKKGSLMVRGEVAQEFAARVKEGLVANITDEADDTQAWKGKVVKVGSQYLPKRSGGMGMIDMVGVNDERVLECLISIEVVAGEPGPKYGQKVRVTLE